MIAEQIFATATKECSVCGSLLPATEEYFYSAGAGGYLKSSCMACDRAMRKLRYQLAKADAPKSARSREEIVKQVRKQIRQVSPACTPPLPRIDEMVPANIRQAVTLAQKQVEDAWEYYLLLRELHKTGKIASEYRLLALQEFVTAQQTLRTVQRLEQSFH
jgi:hypothetical protein